MAALTTEGFITSTTPQIIAEGADSGILVIRLITLYNPNTAAMGFILRKVVPTDTDQELKITRFDDSIPATDTWPFGLNGTPIMLLFPGQRYEVVLDSFTSGFTGVHWCCDLGRA